MISPNRTPRSLDDYSDIINLPRPISKTRPRMDRNSRAAQFAPYAALVGHRDIIANEENLAATKTNLDRDITIELDPDQNPDFNSEFNSSQSSDKF